VLSSWPRWTRPRVQAKIEAIGLVEVSLPFWCSRSWTRGLVQRGQLDNTPEVVTFAEELERACVDVVNLQPPLNGSHVLASGDPGLTVLAATGESQILSHDSLVTTVSTRRATRLPPTLLPLSSPGPVVSSSVASSLLVLTVVTGHGSVCGLGLVGRAVGGSQSGGHQTES
jgi:hypothetical protein